MKANTTEDQRATLRTTALCIIAFVGMSALCATLFFKNYADPTVLVAIISTTGTAVGALMNGRPAIAPVHPPIQPEPPPAPSPAVWLT